MTLSPTQIRFAAWSAMAVLGGWLLAVLAPVLSPFILGAVLAYVLLPLVDRCARWGWPRWAGATLALFLVVLVFMAVVLLIVPVITQQIPLLREQIPSLLERFNAVLLPLAQQWGWSLQIDVAIVRDWLTKLVSGHESELFEHVFSSLRIGGSALMAVLGNLVLAPMVAFYLLVDWQGLMGRLRQLVPPRWLAGIDGFLTETDAVLGEYLRGQLLVMAALAVFYSAGLALVGLDLALAIGVFTGLAVFVPYIGFGVGVVLGTLAALLEFQSLTGVLAVWVVLGVGQFLESFVLTPRLLGERIGLHPLVVIFALMAFGHLFGFVGVLVALPISAVLLVVLRLAVRRYRDSDLYTDGHSPSTQDTPR
jgi:predicted PurR-regulated permease PerM